ncbi:MAG: hypothetical protein HYZ90_05065 [Candidatus Omnitrophica bacterium]|nr:hypothetical protein [Candidatus Omnitrophota bacterium]
MVRYTPRGAMEAINAAFLRIPKEEIRQILERREKLSVRHGVSMFTSRGKPRIIDVQLRPWGVDAAQRRFFHRTSLVLRSALERLMPLYLQNPSVRRVLPLEPKEHEWMMLANARRIQEPQAVLDRLDTTATFAVEDWRENFWFLEPNSVGIGGVHYIPATCELTRDWVLPSLRRVLPDLRLVPHDDIRELLLKLFIRHTKALGRRLRRVALVEDQSVCGGTDEFAEVARYFTRRGLSAFAADPREVKIRKGGLTVRGKGVDLLYRDSEITEMFEMSRERGGAHSIEGMKEAFIRNQVVSSVAGEFDHKSAWELFTNPEFSRHFTFRQKRLFKGHLLWTRLIWPRKTTRPDGRQVDLTAYIRRHREDLVIKPNRAYGGEGVLFGHQASPSLWEKKLGLALRRPFTHVVQQSAPVRAELFPVAASDGSVSLQPFYAVTGFAAQPEGIAFLGRSSKEAVVNVSRKGGLIAIWRLAG